MSLDDQRERAARFPDASDVASASPGSYESGKICLDFKATDFVVNPAHGVGQVLSIEEQTFVGTRLEFS